MSFSRFAFAGLIGIFLTTHATAFAATGNATIHNPILDQGYQPPLVLLDGAIEPATYLPFFSNQELDRLKTEAAMKGLVVMAAVSVTGTASKEATKTRAMIAAEKAIHELNVPFYTAIMMFACGGLMWLCAGLQRERI